VIGAEWGHYVHRGAPHHPRERLVLRSRVSEVVGRHVLHVASHRVEAQTAVRSGIGEPDPPLGPVDAAAAGFWEQLGVP
jgi:hypothetical protein